MNAENLFRGQNMEKALLYSALGPRIIICGTVRSPKLCEVNCFIMNDLSSVPVSLVIRSLLVGYMSSLGFNCGRLLTTPEPVVGTH
jgi:hypothetical protein